MEQVGVKRLTGLLQEVVGGWRSTGGSQQSFLRLTVNIDVAKRQKTWHG